MMFNDQIYNNGGSPYFDFGEMAEFKIVPFPETHVKMKIFFHGAMIFFFSQSELANLHENS